MQLFRILALAAIVQLSFAGVSSADVVLSKSLRNATTWDSAYTITTMGFGDNADGDINISKTNTTGLGQSFTATADGIVDNIGIGVLRFYSGLTGTMSVYQMFDGDGVSPGANPSRFRTGNSDWMSAPVLQTTFDTSDAGISGSGDPEGMVNFALSNGDEFAVTTGQTYMVQFAGDAGNGASPQPNLMLWGRNNSDPYGDGTYGIPNGGSTDVGGRDVMLAVNIAAPVAVPEPSSALALGLGAFAMLVRRKRNS